MYDYDYFHLSKRTISNIQEKSYVLLGANVTKINCNFMNIVGILGRIRMYKCAMWVSIMSELKPYVACI